ncbi:MAG: lipopolysaccharide transport system ATP-binding protein [Chthoniobacter sp.]|jgi:lipopolysaccharide transport system ATP-binding protein|nr:lipopolysaccharide transport system ATP-binding protein [Chthoniobacter sp.]
MAAPMIEVKGLSKRYRLGAFGARSLRDEAEAVWNRLRGKAVRAESPDDFWALQDVSFSVEPGEVIGIIGRNGAGKSTLLKILSRITEPTIGEVILNGRAASLLEVGTGFHPELSGRENIFLNGAILGMTRAEIRRKFDEIVHFAEVENFIDVPVKRYSSGMYVRLAFAVAAHLEPEILIVDEVLAVGDQEFQRKCLGKMQEISSGQGRTILFVSHHMPAIRRLCRKCVVLDRGHASPPLPVDEAIDAYTSGVSESGYDLEVSKVRRGGSTEGRACRITRIRVEGELCYGKSMRIEFTVECFREITDAMLGIGFNVAEGSRVLTLDSDLSRRLLHLRPGTHSVTITLPSLPLHPGFYYCSAGIGSGNHFFDILDSFAVWEVKTSDQDEWSDRGFAGCRLEPEVTLATL